MYWPTDTARVLSAPPPLDASEVVSIKPNLKGSLFASLSKDGLGVWEVRPSVLQAAVVRSQGSLARWGDNLDVFWAHNGRAVIILTSSSHLLVYQLVATQDEAYAPPSRDQTTTKPLHGYQLVPRGAAFVMGGCTGVLARPKSLLLTLRHPRSVLTVPWPIPDALLAPPGSHHPPAPLDGESSQGQSGFHSWEVGEGVGLPMALSYDKAPGLPLIQTLLTEDGGVYLVSTEGKPRIKALHESEDKGVCVSVGRGLVAVGTASGKVDVFRVVPGQPARRLQTLELAKGAVKSLAWTADGYALAAGYTDAWAVWSVCGRLNSWEERTAGHLFWSHTDLFMLSGHIAAQPFAKSASTSQMSPDNTDYGLLQLDDRVLVYRGADQPDTSVIKASDSWQHVKVPDVYTTAHWPIRYASISLDGSLLAVAGKKGLAHYSLASGRWKVFADPRQEDSFAVNGGLLWFHHVLVAAVETAGAHQIRLYSRDHELGSALHSITFASPVLVMTLHDNALLVYTADNNLHHYLILPTRDTIKLHGCGSISFGGIISSPASVRGVSWIVPRAQKDLGEPTEDLFVANILFLVDTQLVLLRPRRTPSDDQVRYDMQILADRTETYWTGRTLENSLWAYDGEGLRVWLDPLKGDSSSVPIELDFCPLAVLMDKGLVVGINSERSAKTPGLFTLHTASHLFLPALIRYHLHHMPSALAFASHYASLPYFAHALERLLHGALENDSLAPVIRFLDHFDVGLDVVIACARKTEADLWDRLFTLTGPPRDLFDQCLALGKLDTAVSYLVVLHTLEPDHHLDDDTQRLAQLAKATGQDHIVQDVVRFSRTVRPTPD